MPQSHPSGGENANIVLLGKEKLELQHRPIPTIKADEVLVKVMATGM